MATQLTAEDAKQSLTAHVEAKGLEIRERYGPRIGWPELVRLLQDRTCVRYPCEIAFDASPLLAGELAYPVPKGGRPEEGFTMHVHPLYRANLEEALIIVLYQLVVVNYGEFAGPEDAEAFGSAVLGFSREEYYQRLCALADRLTPG